MSGRDLDPLLAARLVEVDLDPRRFGDPARAWHRLHERFGRRITLIDRYALEAAHRGLSPDELPPEERRRLARDVLARQYPGLDLLDSASRVASDQVVVVPYRREWVQAFAEWHAKLERSLGKAAVRIEHVGSTAVPGLPAKPIIDVHVSVVDVEAEAAYVPPIEALGILLRAREPGHRYFRPGGSNPRTVQIHVCAAGGEWEREHLLFRDYLRAHASARSAYARVKQELASRWADDRLAYNEGKTAFILDALDGAHAWAAETRWRGEQPLASD